MLLSLEHVEKSYGDRKLLDDVTLYILPGDRTGIVGVNGCGKSTFLKLAAGVEEADAGTVTKDPNVRISYLEQNPPYNPELTVLEQVMLNCPADSREIEEYEAREVLNRLGISAYDAKMGQLSGGQKKRAALAACLMSPADILILDEPTNHLDVSMIEWLEKYLEEFSGAVLFVTHDRYFLERLSTKTGEISFGKLYIYGGGYSSWLDGKADREKMEAASERKRQSILRRELIWVMQGPCARGTKSRERLERYEALKSKQPPQTDSEIAEVKMLASRLGRKTIQAENACVSYDGHEVIRNFNLSLLRDDRIGIVGKNGTGKTTILNLLAGYLLPSSGTVTIGETVKTGYFSQHGEEMDPNMTAVEYVKERGGEIETADGRLSAEKLMELFLFPPTLQYRKISKLSGGERRRLFLLGILASAPNVLMLDEPTNDLDIHTLQVLENYLMAFPGAVIAVSHDRYFLDRVCKRYILTGPGPEPQHRNSAIENYSELFGEGVPAKSRLSTPENREKNTRLSSEKTKLRFSFKEQREYETIEDDIAKLEAELEENAALQDAHCSDYVELQALNEKRLRIQEKLDEKMERWVYLTELAQKIDAQKK